MKILCLERYYMWDENVNNLTNSVLRCRDLSEFATKPQIVCHLSWRVSYSTFV